MDMNRLKQRIRTSLRLKLALLLSVVIAVMTIAFTSYIIANERHAYRTRLDDKGNILASILTGSLRIPLYAGYNEEVALHTSQIFANGDVASVKVFTGSGELIAAASAPNTRSDGTGLTITRQITTHSGQTPETLLLGESPPDLLTGTIELTMDQSQLARMSGKLLLGATLLALLFWFATSALTFLVLGKVTTTFQQLMAGVKKIEDGDLSSRLPTSGSDEPGRALAAINSLAVALQNKNEENRRLQAKIVKGLETQLDEEKSRNMAKLIQTNRMTSLGLLVSSMAHEINNPNGAIRLAGEILENAWKDILPILDELAAQEGESQPCDRPYSYVADDIETAIDAILRNSTRIERVVQNLRTYSLGDRESEQTTFDLNRIAENAIAIVRAHGKMEQITINAQLAPLLPSVCGNPFQLEQVVINLLLNAIQAMAGTDATTIVLSTELHTVKNEVVLAVQDSGPGIKADALPHIFEPFFSTRIDEGGSGLGLYISNFLVKEQNGKLELDNCADGGCRATIRLPSAEPVTPLPSSLPASC